MKVLSKIILITLVVLFVAVGVCYLVVPDWTKSTIDIVVEWFNKPLPIIGVSITALCLVGYKFLSYTSIGKSALNKLENDIKNAKEKALEYKKEAEEIKKETEIAINEQKAFIKAQSTEIDTLKEYIIKLCATIPNAKVNALGIDMDNAYNGVKQELKVALEDKENKLANYLDTTQNKIEISEEYIKSLIEEKLGELNNGEREEGIND